MSVVMQQLKQKVCELEKDEIEDYGSIKNCYDSTLSDIIIFEWQDMESPWNWIVSDTDLLEEFKRIFNHNKTNVDLIKIYRGTDYQEYLKLKKGDILDYSERYTSWTTDFNVSIKFTISKHFILFIYEGPIISFDLNKTNSLEAEHILPPTKFLVKNVINVKGIEDLQIQRNLAQEALNGGEMEEDGKIFILKLID